MDASFSESKPLCWNKIPLPPNIIKTTRGHQSRGRPPKSVKNSNEAQASQELCSTCPKYGNASSPVFRRTQQTSRDTALWSFSDGGHDTLCDEESSPIGPRTIQHHETSNESTTSYHQRETDSEPELMTLQAPEKQLGLNHTHQQSIQKGNYVSEPDELSDMLRSLSSREISRLQLNPSIGRIREPYQQQNIMPGPSSVAKSHQPLNVNGGHGFHPSEQQFIEPGPSSREIACQQPNKIRRHTSQHYQHQHAHLGSSSGMNSDANAFRTEPCSGKKRSQLNQTPSHSASELSSTRAANGHQSLRQSSNLNEIANTVFQDYVKRNIEFLKIHFREMTAKIDDLLASRPKPCICTMQRMEENEEQFTLPMDSFGAIEEMEKTLSDQQTRQQMVLILLRMDGVNLQKTVYSIMEKLFTYEIGMQYTWTGKPTKEFEKEKFSNLTNIYAAICDLSGDEET
ncbi:uncharacterized protein LOC130702870 [Daphnia carinata]|uniref:uncharacterized protein LOC130702870 n=1 Tax=Daphnia carinata TaxID=120202 RepID=UPI00257BADCD|nr:uncharacterized protein LOC130702870 [Daphnia carinata]